LIPTFLMSEGFNLYFSTMAVLWDFTNCMYELRGRRLAALYLSKNGRDSPNFADPEILEKS
jgi:hypothetical protein